MNDFTSLFADTNALIRLLEGDELVVTLLFEKIVYISTITEMEMQCKPNQPRPARQLIKSLLDDCIIIEIDPRVKTRAIQIRQTTRMKSMDSIIAASALVTGLPLVTGDAAFERVSALNLLLLPVR